MVRFGHVILTTMSLMNRRIVKPWCITTFLLVAINDVATESWQYSTVQPGAVVGRVCINKY